MLFLRLICGTSVVASSLDSLVAMTLRHDDSVGRDGHSREGCKIDTLELTSRDVETIWTILVGH